MSVVTTADERLSSAQEHIVAAIGDLTDVVVNECWGHDDYRPDYTVGIREVLCRLIELKSKLHR
jgi:hypothetical protein